MECCRCWRLLGAAMAGPDPHDAATQSARRVDFAAALEGAPHIAGMRITALAEAQFPPYTLPDVARARAAALAVLRECGAIVDEAPVPLDFEALALANGRIIAAEAWALHRAYIEDETLDIDPWVRARVISGKTIGAAEYLGLLETRRLMMAKFADWMRGREALLTPTLPITAVPVPDVDESTTPLAAFTRAANYLGACALSLPAGLSSGGLPIGVQLTGAPFADATLVRDMAARSRQRPTGIGGGRRSIG